MCPIEIVDSEHASGTQRLVVELANDLRPGEIDEDSGARTRSRCGRRIEHDMDIARHDGERGMLADKPRRDFMKMPAERIGGSRLRASDAALGATGAAAAS